MIRTRDNIVFFIGLEIAIALVAGLYQVFA